MSTTFLYALILAVGQILLTLIGFFLGYQTENMNSGAWFGSLSLVLSIAVLWLGLKAVREESPDRSLTYGHGVFTGLLISLYAGLIGAVYTYIHFTFINPSFPDYMIEASRAKWAAAGLQESQMEGAEKGIRFFTQPILQAGLGVVLTVVFGLILTLIIAAFLKRPPADAAKIGAAGIS